MEPEYEQLLQLEEPGPAGSDEAPKPHKPWGDGIVVYGPSQLLRGKQVPSLMADSYGGVAACAEVLSGTRRLAIGAG